MPGVAGFSTVEVAPAQEKREGSWSGGVREGERERGSAK
jgi:hypothetical protein